MLRLDHLAVSGLTREDASDHMGSRLGVTPVKGGEHDHFGTHNTLLGLGDHFYMEAIAINPDVAPLPYPRWFNLDNFAGQPRLTNWIVACDDIHAALDVLGPGYGTPVSLTRGDLKWQMAVPETGILPFDGFAPAIIEWGGDIHPAPSLPDCGLRLSSFTVQHPEAGAMQAQLADLLPDDRVKYAVGPAKLFAEFTGSGGNVTLA